MQRVVQIVTLNYDEFLRTWVEYDGAKRSQTLNSLSLLSDSV